MDAASEYCQVRENAGIFDASERSKIEVVGPDGAAFLHNLSTNDIRALPIGAGCEAFLTNAKAKVISFVSIYHLAEDSFWLDSDPGIGGSIIQHLNRYLISEQVEIRDRTKEFSQFYVLGPGSRELIAKVLGLGAEALQDWECRFLQGPNAIPCQVRFHRRFVIDCHELIFPADESGIPKELLASAGALPVGPETFEIIRVEAGLPVFGIDIDENVLAPEVGRSAISYNKGCYLGQETIVRIRDLGHVNGMLRGLKLLHGNAMPPGSKILFENKEVGEVTSSVRSPGIGCIIGLAYLHRTCQEPGTRVEVAVGTDRLSAEVSSLPFGQSGYT
jgi:folate-binding protein YgfZ